MALRISIRHLLSMQRTDLFVEGLRRIFDARPDLKPSAVSVEAGLDNSTIRKLISGANSSPKVETAQKIAAAMGYQLSDIIAIGEHEDPTVALDWLRVLETVSPEVREEAIKYALYLQAKNAAGAVGMELMSSKPQEEQDPAEAAPRPAPKNPSKPRQRRAS